MAFSLPFFLLYHVSSDLSWKCLFFIYSLYCPDGHIGATNLFISQNGLKQHLFGLKINHILIIAL